MKVTLMLLPLARLGILDAWRLSRFDPIGVEGGLGQGAVAVDLGVSRRTLRRWCLRESAVGLRATRRCRPARRWGLEEPQTLLHAVVKHGPWAGVKTLRKEFPAIPRSEIRDSIVRMREVYAGYLSRHSALFCADLRQDRLDPRGFGSCRRRLFGLRQTSMARDRLGGSMIPGLERLADPLGLPSRVISSAAASLQDWQARAASHGAVDGEALGTRLPPSRGEVVRDLAARPEVPLVGRLSVEGGVGEAPVVLLDAFPAAARASADWRQLFFPAH